MHIYTHIPSLFFSRCIGVHGSGGIRSTVTRPAPLPGARQLLRSGSPCVISFVFYFWVQPICVPVNLVALIIHVSIGLGSSASVFLIKVTVCVYAYTHRLASIWCTQSTWASVTAAIFFQVAVCSVAIQIKLCALLL